ncbi:GntR family transcriptional regulator [Roseomonas terrae]|jgi:DNA-binding GntR family transcriptional regulator|uniref:GntR family transcriptional regulator n=1 Tax=Neoroseomonas terrae TaxID=424799 RepID=A0ABS5EAS3_9PROT|nr:GntR family transcriptional regulator [Neoroseomonas terrae]MBR0648127.1 GntR family transcriptional regulator [Neoroseomonas terrae]
MSIRQPRPKRGLAMEIALLIRQGDYRAGEWLRQIDLEHRLGANRFDVRTALAELALRGTVQHVPNRGFRVSSFDRVRLRQMLEVRVLLEVEAAVAALPYVDAAALARLRIEMLAFERAADSGTRAEQNRTNLAFHDGLYALTPNRALAEMVTELRERARLWPTALWPSAGALRQSVDGHRRIMAALEDGDAPSLADAVRAHIRNSIANDPSLEMSQAG